jgi:hypothetical protein
MDKDDQLYAVRNTVTGNFQRGYYGVVPRLYYKKDARRVARDHNRRFGSKYEAVPVGLVVVGPPADLTTIREKAKKDAL